MEIKYNSHATNILFCASGNSVREGKEKYSYTLVENEVHFSILFKKRVLVTEKSTLKECTSG